MCKSELLSKTWKWLVILVMVVIILITIVLLCYHLFNQQRPAGRPFPRGFLFGVASSSYQIEGAWNEDGRSESVWDYVCHIMSHLVRNCSNADIAADSYHLYKRDVEMMRELGIDFYRFSLSWSRLLPTGLPDRINAAGVDFYNNYINEMIKYNITPMVTLFHWDVPRTLLEMGGLSNPNSSDWFVDYARIAFRLFGDRVKFWITVNEPEIVCSALINYADVFVKSGSSRKDIRGLIEYNVCFKAVLLIHARAWHLYDEEFRASQGGNISIAIHLPWYASEDKYNTRDNEAAYDLMQLIYSIADPIFSKTGGFPPGLLQKLAAKSVAQGHAAAASRLSEFTDEERTYVRGTSDYFGLNHYTSMFVNSKPFNMNKIETYFDIFGVGLYSLLEWDLGGTVPDKFYTPWAFYNVLTKVRQDYNNWPVYVLENGFSIPPGLQDDARVTYFRGYLGAMLDAIDEGSDVRGYTVWSLMDGFEWFHGYTNRYGLYEVDFEDPARTRRPRKSAFVYKHIVRTRALDAHYEPDTYTMTIDDGH